MPILTEKDELGGYKPYRWRFWRDVAVYFCVFSVVGHWIEIGYCSIMALFGIVSADSLVWDDPFYPFLVYGIGATLFTIVFVPLKEKMLDHSKSTTTAGMKFLAVAILICIIMELTMGFMLNRPDASGVYPLWDNSQLPGNIFKQAWIVNDVMLGLLAMLYTWLIYPLCEKGVAKLSERTMNLVSVIVVVGFIVLCVVKFS